MVLGLSLAFVVVVVVEPALSVVVLSPDFVSACSTIDDRGTTGRATSAAAADRARAVFRALPRQQRVKGAVFVNISEGSIWPLDERAAAIGYLDGTFGVNGADEASVSGCDPGGGPLPGPGPPGGGGGGSWLFPSVLACLTLLRLSKRLTLACDSREPLTVGLTIPGLTTTTFDLFTTEGTTFGRTTGTSTCTLAAVAAEESNNDSA
ncbi:MAG TPA: hypothetical protein VK804_02915 [Bradyrhizobium sp.]|jgi:hypothetical protein|uniref:hypothetical protein n=1 Tax=Bradyrhizobium sp. TaxID=376 RepID=UPI002C9DA304|nr:hypothetical protein [Bradyrhizobium sp.]HTA99401.1 hypothetical protein [Bradyrhizobium sp.]